MDELLFLKLNTITFGLSMFTFRSYAALSLSSLFIVDLFHLPPVDVPLWITDITYKQPYGGFRIVGRFLMNLS